MGGTELDLNDREDRWGSTYRISLGTTYGAHIDIATGAWEIPIYEYTGSVWKSSGNSYAAPQVAGVAALMLMVNPALTPNALKARLRNSADILEDFDGLDAAGNLDATEKNLAGGRRLNAYRAVKLALGEVTVQTDPLPEIVWNTDAFTSSIPPPLVLWEHGLGTAGGWKITQTDPVEVARMGGTEDNAVSSLIISAGYTVEVFRDSDFMGTSQTYTGPQRVDLTGQALDNQISSYKLSVTPPLVLREHGLGTVGGWEITQTDPVEVASLGAHNDQVSSLLIADGYTVQVFRYDDFKAARQTYVGPQAVDLTGNVLDNRINSYKFYATPDVAEAEALVLRESRVGVPSAWEIAHNDPVEVASLGADNDQVSSLIVAAGYTVEVFRHPDFRGFQKIYFGPQGVDLTGRALDNQISSYKLYVTPVVAEALVLRERGLHEAGGWEIVHTAPVEVAEMEGAEDNAISSLRIGAGYAVRVFRHRGFGGPRRIYRGPQEVDLTGRPLDNQISSYKLYATP